MVFLFCSIGLCLSTLCAFFALVLHLCYLTLASHYFIENSLFHFSDAVFSLCLSLFRFHCALFTHRTSNEIYQCQMKHRILLNHIQSFSKWTRLKRSDLLVVFFCLRWKSMPPSRFHHLIIHFYDSLRILFRFIHSLIWFDLIELLLRPRLDLWTEHTQKKPTKQREKEKSNILFWSWACRRVSLNGWNYARFT